MPTPYRFTKEKPPFKGFAGRLWTWYVRKFHTDPDDLLLNSLKWRERFRGGTPTAEFTMNDGVTKVLIMDRSPQETGTFDQEKRIWYF